MAEVPSTQRRVLGALLVSLLLCLPALADRERAKSLYEEGTRHYDLGRFDEAAELYEQAYEAERLPALLFNIAQAHLEGGRHERAIFFFESYLREVPDASNRDLVLRRIEEATAALELDKQARVAESERQRAQLEAERAERERERAAENRLRAEQERAKLEVQARAQEAAARAREAEANAKAKEAEAQAATPLHEQTWFWPTLGAGAAVAVLTAASALTTTGVVVVVLSASNADTLEPIDLR